MSEQIIIEQCSPTLAGLKTANLFSCKYDCKKKLWEDIRCFNALLIHKGIRMIPLNAENNRALIYVFRPKKLESDISDKKQRNSAKARVRRKQDKFMYCKADRQTKTKF